MVFTFQIFKKKLPNSIFPGLLFASALAFTLLFAPPLYAQVPVYQQQDIIKDTTINSHPAVKPPVLTKHFGRAATELLLVEVLPWSWDKFLKKADYANISFKTVGHNLQPSSWTWDDDNFQTNQIGHPYHGSQFYTAFRANGYTFWQSVPAALVGSYIWESTAENQPPAINDFINTSFGGVVLGEMTYRLSNKIVNNQARGFKRQASEVIALVINPMNGLNRILRGQWGKVSGNSKERDSSKISAQFGAGIRGFDAVKSNGASFGWYGSIKLLYGTPYEHYDIPFSNIAINTEFGKDDSSKVNIVSVYGSLAGWEISSTEKYQHLAVLSANYDYIHNEAFFYGGQSVKINLLSEFDLSEKNKINTSLGAGPIILAAVPDQYLYLPHGRNYDYVTGFGINGSGRFTIDDKFMVAINYKGGWMKTINGIRSHYFLHTASTEISYQVLKQIAFGAETGYFNLRGYYQNYPNVSKNYPYLRMSMRYIVEIK